MKTIPCLALVFGLSSAALSAAPGLLSLLFSHHDFEVIADGDVLPAGKDLPRPTPNKPLYYMAIAAGYQDFGKAIPGDKKPTQKAMIDVITRVLDKQGYKLATNKNPPEVAIVYSWGTMNASRWFMPWTSAQGGGFTNSPSMVLNARQVLGFLGYTKGGRYGPMENAFPELAPGLSILRDKQQQLWELGSLDYYVIALAAFDYRAMKQEKAKLLWRTHISTPSMGFDMFDALPKMAAIAAPQIGRQTDSPVHILAADHYRPDIEIGTATVVPAKSEAN